MSAMSIRSRSIKFGYASYLDGKVRTCGTKNNGNTSIFHLLQGFALPFLSPLLALIWDVQNWNIPLGMAPLFLTTPFY